MEEAEVLKESEEERDEEANIGGSLLLLSFLMLAASLLFIETLVRLGWGGVRSKASLPLYIQLTLQDQDGKDRKKARTRTTTWYMANTPSRTILIGSKKLEPELRST